MSPSPLSARSNQHSEHSSLGPISIPNPTPASETSRVSGPLHHFWRGGNNFWGGNNALSKAKSKNADRPQTQRLANQIQIQIQIHDDNDADDDADADAADFKC